MKACFITALVISLLATGLSLPGNELQMSAAKQAFLGERLLDILQERLAEVQEEDEAVDETSSMAMDRAQISATVNVGVSYTRWGNNGCPAGAQLVYSGKMAGSHYTHSGGGANYICLTDQPDYNIPSLPRGPVSYLYGTEYQHPIKGVHDDGAPCAVCYVSGRTAKEMIPGTTACPGGWTREYYGYLMSGHFHHKGRNEYICVDKDQKSLPNSAGNQDGALLYHVHIDCSTDIRCPPYNPSKSLTCTVCSK